MVELGTDRWSSVTRIPGGAVTGNGGDDAGRHLANPIICLIGNVDVAVEIYRNTLRLVERCAGGRPSVTRKTRNPVASECRQAAARRHFPNDIAVSVGYVQIAVVIHGQSLRIVDC